MERNPNPTPIPVSDYSGCASEQQPPSACSADRKEGRYQSNGYPPSQPFSQGQQHQRAYREQPDTLPPKWVRTLLRLILESSTPC